MQTHTIQASRVQPPTRATASQQQQPAPARPQGRRQLLSAGLGLAALAAARPAAAAFSGIESVDLPALEQSSDVTEKKARSQAVLDDAEATFQNSDLLRTLKERSDANRGARKKELEDKYCMRQAELGVGDCGGLRYIPGMTKSGVQKRPQWMNEMLGLKDDQ